MFLQHSTDYVNFVFNVDFDGEDSVSSPKMGWEKRQESKGNTLSKIGVQFDPKENKIKEVSNGIASRSGILVNDEITKIEVIIGGEVKVFGDESRSSWPADVDGVSWGPHHEPHVWARLIVWTHT